MEADFIRTIGAGSLHSGDDGSALGGTMKATCSFGYLSSLHFSYRISPQASRKICSKTRWEIQMDLVGNSISYLGHVYMPPLSRPIDSGL